MKKRIFFWLISVVSVFSSSIITRAEDIDMRFVTDSFIKEQLMKQVEQSKQCLESLLYYLAESDRPNIEEVTISDKITMTVDEAIHKTHFTTFFMNKDKVIGQAVIIYRFDKKKETVDSLYIHALLGDLLDHLEFCEIQHSLNQSEKTSIEELTDPGQIYTISLEDFLAAIKPTITDTNSVEIKQQLSELKFDIQSYRITEDDYKAEQEECEEEDEG